MVNRHCVYGGHLILKNKVQTKDKMRPLEFLKNISKNHSSSKTMGLDDSILYFR